jgi:hydroxyquinol 1,2-dioxygenase
MAAIQWLTRTGQISDDKGQEFILASDVLGPSMLVVQLNHHFDDRATPATVLGPFHIDGFPELDVDEARLRGKFASRDDGTYCVRTITPRGYTIPMDGTVGDLIGRTDISHSRPAHVHFLVTAPGFESLITHLFEQGAR